MKPCTAAVFASVFFALTWLMAAATPAAEQLQFDHFWIVVSPNAPERAALERAGFQISPDVNRHDGQGTASISVEFENAYLELMWPDSTVEVQPGLEKAAEKFHQRMMWHTSGWSPIGVGFRRTSDAATTFPFPTWSTHADWLPKGSDIVILTPRDDTHSPSLFVTPRALTDMSEQEKRAAKFHHPIGVRRITAVRLVSPKSYEPIAQLTYLEQQHLLQVKQGDDWLVEVTFDDGKAKRSKDLRPDLPLMVRY
jgi:hypothetical protein